jgi:uncharacterized protein
VGENRDDAIALDCPGIKLLFRSKGTYNCNNMATLTILWRRIDMPGFESARLISQPGTWRLEGCAVFAAEGQPCRLDYQVVCNAGWETRSAHVMGWVGSREIKIDLLVDAARRWRLNGMAVPAVRGCVDVDLSFSPVTNLLPIRRLGLAGGEEAQVKAAWLVFPGFSLEPLEQRYRRVDEALYRYESRDGSFVRDLRVSPAGFILEYPGFWSTEALSES